VSEEQLGPTVRPERRWQRDGVLALLPGREIERGQVARGDDGALAGDRPASLDEIPRVDEVVPVLDPDLAGAEVHRRGVDVAIDVLEGGQPRVRSAIGADQPVHARVAVVVQPARVFPPAAVGEEGGGTVGAAIGRRHGLSDPLFDPVPDEAAAHVVAGIDAVPVFLQAAIAVAHRVGILVQQERHLGARAGADQHLVGRAIGVRVDVRVRAAEARRGLVVNRTRGIAPLGPLIRGRHVRAVARLVTR
jgi:hypothetical protein